MFNFIQSGTANMLFYKQTPELIKSLCGIHSELKRMNNTGKKMKNDKVPNIYVESVEENEDGTSNIKLELSDEFLEQYLKDNNLKEFDKKHFNTWFVEALTETLDLMDKNEKEKNTDH